MACGRLRVIHSSWSQLPPLSLTHLTNASAVFASCRHSMGAVLHMGLPTHTSYRCLWATGSRRRDGAGTMPSDSRWASSNCPLLCSSYVSLLTLILTLDLRLSLVHSSHTHMLTAFHRSCPSTQPWTEPSRQPSGPRSTPATAAYGYTSQAHDRCSGSSRAGLAHPCPSLCPSRSTGGAGRHSRTSRCGLVAGGGRTALRAAGGDARGRARACGRRATMHGGHAGP